MKSEQSFLIEFWQRIMHLSFDWDTNEMSILLQAKLAKPLMGTARIVINSLHIKGDVRIISFLLTPTVRSCNFSAYVAQQVNSWNSIDSLKRAITFIWFQLHSLIKISGMPVSLPFDLNQIIVAFTGPTCAKDILVL